MWGTLLSLVLGAVPGVIRELANAKVKLAEATTERQRIEAQESIKALETKRDVLISQTNSPWTNIFRASILFPFSFYITWTTIWDKIACKWFFNSKVCTTDPLEEWQLKILMIGIGYLFITDVSKIWKR